MVRFFYIFLSLLAFSIPILICQIALFIHLLLFLSYDEKLRVQSDSVVWQPVILAEETPAKYWM